MDDKARGLVISNVIPLWGRCGFVTKLYWVCINRAIEAAYVQKK